MEYVKSVAEEYKPWRKDVAWQAVALQAAIAIAIGAYFLIAPDSANATIRFLLAAILIVASLIDINAGFNQFYAEPERRNHGAPYLLVRGGAGVAMGIVYFVVTRYDFMTESDARYVLGFGMIAYAVIGFVAMFMAILKGQFLWPGLLANLLFLLLGGVLVYNRLESVSSSSAVEYLGVAAVVGGICLAVYAWYLRNEQRREPAEAATAAGSATTASIPPVAAASVPTAVAGVIPGENVSAAAESASSKMMGAADAVIDGATKG